MRYGESLMLALAGLYCLAIGLSEKTRDHLRLCQLGSQLVGYYNSRRGSGSSRNLSNSHFKCKSESFFLLSNKSISIFLLFLSSFTLLATTHKLKWWRHQTKNLQLTSAIINQRKDVKMRGKKRDNLRILCLPSHSLCIYFNI